MLENNRAATNENRVKIGKFNLPTIAFSVILISVFSLASIKAFKPQDNILAQIVFLSCPIASITGLMTLIWCFLIRKQFTGKNNGRYFREAVLVGIAAFTSPIWLVILALIIFGFNR